MKEMTAVKTHKGKTQIALFTVLALIAGLFIGYKMGVDEVPKNCGELGALHLQIGRKELGITDSNYNNEKWSKLIDDETALTNLCYKSIEQK